MSIVGICILYGMLMAYSIVVSIGFGTTGLINSAPVMCALVISTVAFIFTVFKTNGYLFHFKEYDMLMSLPFETRTVAACKFLYMYCKSVPWYLSIAIAMLIGYAYYTHPSLEVYLLWLILSVFLPVIPMLAASFLGFVIARIGSGFRKSNLIQTVLTFLFVIFCFSLRFIIEDLVRNRKVESTLETASMVTEKAASWYLPARWFADAVLRKDLLSALILLCVSTLLFAILFFIVGKSYRNINSALKSHAASKNYRMRKLKRKSVVHSIAFKEYKRFTGSTVYMVNAAIGIVLAPLLGILTVVIGFEKIIRVFIQDAPLNVYMLQPAIPFIIYFMVGMMATTACSFSLEGKNYWILQSLPISKKKICQGKMLFHICLTVPSMAFSTLCFCISAKVSVPNTVLFLLLGFLLCCFSTVWGCVCGISHMRLDWENEVEVIKQGSAVVFYLFPNLIVSVGLIILSVFLGTRMNHSVLTLLMMAITAVPTALCYIRAVRLSKTIL